MNESSQVSTRLPEFLRQDFVFFEEITLRYSDNDANGHVNNAQYYSFFDTAVDAFLKKYDYRKFISGPLQTFVVASECRYFRELSSPGNIRVGVKIGRIGNSTVTYFLGIFNEDDVSKPAAQGTFTHCCVTRSTKRPTSVPDALRRLVSGSPA
jgi:acyl-CoA thioester hydrolase